MPIEGGITLPPDEPLDQERRMYYSANWQLLEEHIDVTQFIVQEVDDFLSQR